MNSVKNCLKMQGARWYFDFSKWNPTKSDLLLATTCIQSEEKTRIARFVFKKDFKASLIGRLMMRKFVHETTNYPYNSITFLRDEKGKPYTNIPNLSFNVSHQGDYAVLAGSHTSHLGVDVMKLEYTGGKNLSEFFRIMTKHFSPSEWEAIKTGDDTQQISTFCRHWCLKESYVKAIGVGITVNLQEISFKIKEPLSDSKLVDSTELFVKGVRSDWVFEEMLLGRQHCVAVAGTRIEGETFKELTFEELVKGAVGLLAPDPLYCDKFFDKLEKK